jgi:FlaA1/EpsC-like NDP-sugar epimerase
MEQSGFGAYVMEMGEPVSILNLGRAMIRESGKLIKVAISGLRPGEKLGEQITDEYEV